MRSARAASFSTSKATSWASVSSRSLRSRAGSDSTVPSWQNKTQATSVASMTSAKNRSIIGERVAGSVRYSRQEGVASAILQHPLAFLCAMVRYCQYLSQITLAAAVSIAAPAATRRSTSGVKVGSNCLLTIGATFTTLSHGRPVEGAEDRHAVHRGKADRSEGT